jgi:hypothetical protein
MNVFTGRNQPGCYSWTGFYTCDHSRAYYYFAESLIEPSFYSTRCKDENPDLGKDGTNLRRCCEDGVYFGGEPGNDLYPQKRGVFYLETNSETPYSKSRQASYCWHK